MSEVMVFIGIQIQLFSAKTRHSMLKLAIVNGFLVYKCGRPLCFFNHFYKNPLNSQLRNMGIDVKAHVADADRPFTVFIEGNIGSGKTTFLNYFKKPNTELLSEPTDIWRDVRGHNILDMMYKDPARWSFTFQSLVQKTMLELHVKPSDNPIKFMERSLYSARYCFVENLYKEGLMSPPEYAVIDEWFKWITANINIPADMIIYLRADPEVVYERIQNRGRVEESTLQLEYLTKLHKLHEDWLVHHKAFTPPVPVIVINANQNVEEIIKEFQNYEPEIINKIVAKQNLKPPVENESVTSPSKLKQLIFGSASPLQPHNLLINKTGI